MTTQYVACKVMAAKYILIRFFRKFYAYPSHNMWDTLNSIPFWCLLLHRYFPPSLLNRDFVTVQFPWPCVTIISYSYFNSQVSTIICTMVTDVYNCVNASTRILPPNIGTMEVWNRASSNSLAQLYISTVRASILILCHDP